MSRKESLFFAIAWWLIDEEIAEFQRALKNTVCNSVRATPDTERAALAAADMIDVAFNRLRRTVKAKAA